jgi:hypothetical protein
MAGRSIGRDLNTGPNAGRIFENSERAQTV